MSVTACDAGFPSPEAPTSPAPESIDVWSTSTAHTEAPPRAAARMKVSPELGVQLKALVPEEERRFRGTMRAYPQWKGERPRVRVLDRSRLGVRVEDELTGAEMNAEHRDDVEWDEAQLHERQRTRPAEPRDERTTESRDGAL